MYEAKLTKLKGERKDFTITKVDFIITLSAIDITKIKKLGCDLYNVIASKFFGLIEIYSSQKPGRLQFTGSRKSRAQLSTFSHIANECGIHTLLT